MAASKIAITIDDTILKRLDILVKSKTFPNRSKAICEPTGDRRGVLMCNNRQRIVEL